LLKRPSGDQKSGQQFPKNEIPNVNLPKTFHAMKAFKGIRQPLSEAPAGAVIGAWVFSPNRGKC
jgi:hypothetical protein